jgi:hypothetical protein
MDRLLQVERFDKDREVVHIGVQIIAVPGLTRPAMATAVMGDAPEALRRQKEHLILKHQRSTEKPDFDGQPKAQLSRFAR